jgi:hypothetical protein
MVKKMRMLTNKKAISTIALIILLLCAAIFGALVSYLLVMANYYNMPENTTMLIVEDVVFPDSTVTYFNVTILNPSNSVLDANITAIRINVAGKSEVYNVTETEPELGLMKRGTRQTFKCLQNWGNFAGETVKIEPVAANVSISSYLCAVPKVKLELTPTFDETISVEYFNLTIKNTEDSTMNLTISDIQISWESIKENVTPPLPYVLSPNQNETFMCSWSWDWAKVGKQNFTIIVKTEEGYEAKYTTNELPGAYLYIDEIRFDYTDTSYFNLTVSSSEGSTATAVVSGINLTLQDTTTFPINETRQRIPFKNLPTIFRSIPKNESKTFECYWNWTLYRSTTITVNIYTEQGFTVPSITVNTPPDIVWNITDVKFDLDYIDHFNVTVVNMPCSLQNITVNKILLNETEVTVKEPASATLSNGTQAMFNCSISWRDYIGKTANVTVITEEGLSISRIVEIPAVGLKILEENPVCNDFNDTVTGIKIPYINITILNSNNSLYNVTIVQIIIQTRNNTYTIYNNATYRQNNDVLYPRLRPEEYGPIGYPLNIGETVTFVCSWNYESYLTSEPITVTVYTAEGFQVSRTYVL